MLLHPAILISFPHAFTASTTNLVRHDAHARRILVDKDMVRTAMGTRREDVGLEIGLGKPRFGNGNGEKARDDRFLQPLWQGSINQSVLDQVRGPSLKPAVRELLPPRFWCVCDFVQNDSLLIFRDEVRNVEG